MCLGHRRFQESFKQSRCGSDILASPSEEWGSLIIFEDPPVDVTGVGVCAPAVSAASDLALKLGVFLL
jgi:hypothetical protein